MSIPGRSLEGDFAAGLFDFLLEGFGFVLGDAFLDGLGSSFHQSLGVAEAEAGGVADSLEDLDLGGSVEALEDDVELRLLFSSFTTTSSSARGSHHDAGGSGGGHTEGLFNLLDQLGSFKQGEGFQRFENFVGFCRHGFERGSNRSVNSGLGRAESAFAAFGVAELLSLILVAIYSIL